MALILTETRNSITTITLNRPEKLNAFSGTMREELLAALQTAERDGGTRVVVITGAGRAFCAGGDIEYMASLQKSGDREAFGKLLDAGARVVLQIAEMSKPVIAAINGVAAGAGCNLALACDYRIASDQAKLGETFIRIGLHPDWGGSWLLPRLVGRSRALELMMTGRMVSADEALSIGMINRIAKDLQRETEGLAESIASGPPEIIAAVKRSLRDSEKNDLRAQLDLERGIQLSAFNSDEAIARIANFVKK